MNIATLERVESEVSPGVVYLLRRWTERRRAKLLIEIGSSNGRLMRLIAEASDLSQKLAEANDRARQERKQARGADSNPDEAPPFVGARAVFDSEELGRWIEYQNQLSNIEQNETGPVVLRHGVARIEGLKIDEKDATVEDFIEHAPDELFRELFALVQNRSGLSGEEVKNSESPTTSDGAGVGEMNGTIAPSAKKPDITSTATVESSSPKT